MHKKMERDLIFLGLAGLEHKLQQGVPKTLQAFDEARIKVWMLTGDSMNTSVQLGKLSSLIPLDSFIVQLSETTFEEVERRLVKTVS